MVLQKQQIKNVKHPPFIWVQNEATIYMAIFSGKVTSRGSSNLTRVLDTTVKVCVEGTHGSMTEQYDNDGKEKEEGDEDFGNFHRDEDEVDENAHESLFSDHMA